jgi:hypothetical protein
MAQPPEVYLYPILCPNTILEPTEAVVAPDVKSTDAAGREFKVVISVDENL